MVVGDGHAASWVAVVRRIDELLTASLATLLALAFFPVTRPLETGGLYSTNYTRDDSNIRLLNSSYPMRRVTGKEHSWDTSI